MKVLVTGATSGLGRNAVECLLQEGYQVHATGRNQQAGAELEGLGAEFSALDLATESPDALVHLLEGADWVWHCAALSSPWGAYDDFLQCNTQASDQLAKVAGQVGIKRFVHISTPSIYFDFKHRQEIQESFCASIFANHYAKTKFMAEQAIIQAQKEYPQTRYTMLRPRGLFGPHDRVILPRVLEQVKAGKGVLKLPRGGAALLDLTYVKNVVHALLLASKKDHLPPAAVYNITNHDPQTLASLLTRLLRDEMQMDFRIKAVPYPMIYAVASVMEGIASISKKEPMLTRYSVGALNFDMTLSSELAQRELGYEPIYSLQEGIQETAAWLARQAREAKS